MTTEQPPPSTRDRTPLVIGGGVLLAVVGVILALVASDGPLSPWKAVVLGAVEGITEYLPVSSTGHLLVTQRLLGLGDDDASRTAADTYAIAIQVGAIFAVLALYWGRIRQLLDGVVGRDDEGRTLLLRLVLAFVPAAVIGVIAGDTVKDQLFGPWPIVVAWAVGGVFLSVWKPSPGHRGLFDLTARDALIIGFAQSIALWPGVSRSLVTIVAALAIGMALPAAIEFSFLLGLATLSAATAYDLLKHGGTLLDDYGWETPLLGAIVAFATAVVAVRWLVAFLRERPLSIFGWYRLAAAGVTVVLIATGAV